MLHSPIHPSIHPCIYSFIHSFNGFNKICDLPMNCSMRIAPLGGGMSISNVQQSSFTLKHLAAKALLQRFVRLKQHWATLEGNTTKLWIVNILWIHCLFKLPSFRLTSGICAPCLIYSWSTKWKNSFHGKVNDFHGRDAKKVDNENNTVY